MARLSPSIKIADAPIAKVSRRIESSSELACEANFEIYCPAKIGAEQEDN